MIRILSPVIQTIIHVVDLVGAKCRNHTPILVLMLRLNPNQLQNLLLLNLMQPLGQLLL